MQIRLFGISREIVGESVLTIESIENIETVSALKTWLGNTYPAMLQLRSFAVAVDNEYAEDDQVITHQNEVAIIPPVSGG